MPFTYVNCQYSTESDRKLLRAVAEKVIDETTFTLIDRSTNERFSNSDNLDIRKTIRIESIYNHWKYSNGVIMLSFQNLADLLNDDKYSDHVSSFYRYFFSQKDYLGKLYENGIQPYDFRGFYRMDWLDDCGALGAALIELNKSEKVDIYRDYLESAANFMVNDVCRLEDGTFARKLPYEKTVWLDDLFMSVPFLGKMYQVTEDSKYLDLAIKQVKQFSHYLWDENAGLFKHCYYDDLERTGVAHWGRANGWAMMAQSMLLLHIPDEHPEKKNLIRLLSDQIISISEYQVSSGLYHQLLNKQDSYLETSCTAMFTYTLANAINQGWIDKRYASVAVNGWDGILTKIDSDYNIHGVCRGTGIQTDLAYYYNRPTPVNDFHGIGAIILAGCEIVKLKHNLK